MAQSSAHDWADKQNRTSDVLSATKVNFADMMLRDQTLKGLAKAGFETCSPIQTRAIPLARSGLDLLVQAKSGTGKTLVFAVCILESFKSKLLLPQSLVLAPTREIAVQIEHILRDLGSSHSDFKVESFIGGLDINEDRRKMQKCTTVIGTPGRILHLLKNNVLNVTNIRQFVLDEADKLMTESFRADVLAIGHRMRQKIQTLALSATFEGGVDRQLEKIMHQPIGVTPKREVPILLGVKQFAHVLPATTNASGQPAKLNTMQEMMAKVAAINGIFEKVPFKQCLIFLNTNTRAESYCNYLSQRGWSTDVMMSRLTQEQRLHTFKSFKNFESRILVCTDLMARGVDSENVNLVINLDLPPNSTTYLHRIGRAGRFGTRGMAVSLMTDAGELQQMRVLLGSLGGSKMFVTKFPMDVVQADDVDIWDYHTLDVREKFFGVDDGLNARAEQESMKALRRKERETKKKERKEVDTNNGCVDNVLSDANVEVDCSSPPKNDGDMTETAVIDKPADNHESIENSDKVTSPTNGESGTESSPAAPIVNQSLDVQDWDGLLAKLTSSIDVCQLSTPSALGNVDDNTQLMSASNWLVDATTKQKPETGLNLPEDLFGTMPEFGFTSDISIADEASTKSSVIESIPTSSNTEASAAIVDQEPAIDISFGASTPMIDDVETVAADSTNSEFNFDRLLQMLGGEPPKSTNPKDDDTVMERIRQRSNQLAAAFTYDAKMLGEATPAVSKAPLESVLKVNANEFVPLSRKVGMLDDSPPNESAVTEVTGQAADDVVETAASAKPIVSQPRSQPSNIKESPWTRVDPGLPATVADTAVVCVLKEDAKEEDTDDDNDDETEDESSDEEADLPQQLFMFGKRNGGCQMTNPNPTNWNAIYRHQLQQIQSYVQFSKDFNRNYQ